MVPYDINRRDLLRASVTAGMVGITGCTGDDNGGPTPPDDLPCVQLTGSERLDPSLSVGDPLLGALSFDATLPRDRSKPPNQSEQNVSLEAIPVELHRRAAQLIEDVRGSDAVPTWEDAQLSGTVSPLYRPGFEDNAFFEFEVDPTGFIVLSTGDHDFPIPHWNHIGRPISQLLKRRAREREEAVAKVYRLDTVTYAAENEEGERVARYGAPMLKVQGLTREWFEEEHDISRATAVPRVSTGTGDEGSGTTEFTIKRSGSDPPPVRFEPWESWDELKEDYGNVYELLIEHLRREAQAEWEEYDRPRQLDSETVPTDTLVLLYPDATVKRSGAGAEFVEHEVVSRGELPPAVELSVTDDPGENLDFTVEITYSDGQNEQVEYVVTSTDQQSKVVASGASALDGVGSSHTVSCGGSYKLEPAGSASEQRMYHQFPGKDCDPSAGSVAWGMLFGWADYQAHLGHSPWTSYKEIFLQDGGTTKPDVAAPQILNSSVKNMIEEIKSRVDICVGSTGIVEPSQMVNAHKYFGVDDRASLGLDTEWNLYKYNNTARNRTKERIVSEQTPAVIGTGFGNKYLLAWKYATMSGSGASSACQELFYVNHGEGQTSDPDKCIDNGHGWIPAKAWFCGWIVP